jgi:aconitate hydratase
VQIRRSDGTEERIEVLCRIDTALEVDYFKAGGILHHVLRHLLAG